MNEELKTELGINEWLELIKEDKNLNGAYISIYQYIYLIEKELQELKKQLEEKEKKYIPGEYAINEFIKEFDENILLKNQQKEFIKYLEDYLKLFDYMRIDEQADYDMIEEILQKYKSIIGDDK